MNARGRGLRNCVQPRRRLRGSAADETALERRMRTVLLLLVGLLLLATCLLLGRLFSVSYSGALELTTIAFVAIVVPW